LSADGALNRLLEVNEHYVKDKSLQHNFAAKKQLVIKTGKERLGEKASDNQRVKICKVPVEKRGSKLRLDKCRPTKR